eukprot:COSAG06_NODE_17380_length_944_cov_4.802367_1_plen_35_part_10
MIAFHQKTAKNGKTAKRQNGAMQKRKKALPCYCFK